MAAWLIAAIERVAPRARRVVLAAAAVLLLAGAVVSLTLTASMGGGGHRPTPATPPPSRRTSTSSSRPTLRLPVSASEIDRAGQLARRFLVSYLQFAYGRASAASVEAVMPEVRDQLVREHARVTPAERGRHPRVVSLHVVGMNPGFVLATAVIQDGGIASYRVRFTLQKRVGNWLVSTVQEG